MSITPNAASLEAEAKRIRAAGEILIVADSYERWGPRDAVEQRNALMAQADEADARRRAAIERLERRVAELRASEPAAIRAWVDAHLTLLDAYLARVAATSTEASVARREREQWTELGAGARDRVEQNTYYVRYDPALYQQLFGIEF